MQTVGTSVYDAFIAGPTYKYSAMALADQITSTVSQHSQTTTKVVETVDKVAGTNISDTIKPYMEKIDSVNDTADSVKDNVTVDNLADQTDKQTETFHPTDMQDAIAQAADYQKAYDGLTDAQKAILKNISGFDKLSLAEKLEYIEKLKDNK